MIQGARFGCFALLLLATVASGAASAQTVGGGQSGWVDPPVRGAAPPAVEDSQKPAAETPASNKSSDTATRSERGARVAASKPPPRNAGRSRIQAASRRSPVQVRLGRVGAERRERIVSRPYRAPATPYVYRAERWGAASLEPLPPYRHRRAGWDYLTSGSRAERIEHARAAGYLVMRSRTFAYPNGTRVLSLTPFGEPYLD